MDEAAAGLLAVVFAWAGAVKLVRRPATTAGFAGLGLPAAHVLAVVVPLFELALAATLVVAPAVGAVGALASLAAFTAVLVAALRAGRTGGCGCFGSGRAEPVTPVDLVRNTALAALAVVVLVA